MFKKINLLIGLVIFLSAITYGLVQAGVISFVDGVNIQYVGDGLTQFEDQVPSKAEAENLLIPLSGSFYPSAHLEKNSGGCRIKLGNYSEIGGFGSQYFWQGHSWGPATTTVTSNSANSCICPAGTSRILRRSQNNTIGLLDTTWWKGFKHAPNAFGIIVPVYGWTKDCTNYIKYLPEGCLHGDPGCECGTRYDNCRNVTTDCKTEIFSYTEYLYSCVANSEILKQ